MALKIIMNSLRRVNTSCHSFKTLSCSSNFRVFEQKLLFFANKHFNDSFRICAKFYSNDPTVNSDPTAPPKVRRKKTVEDPKVVLIDEQKVRLVLTLQEADRISKSKNMELVQVQAATDSKKAVYELVPLSKMLEFKDAEDSEKKSIKKMLITAKIMDNDLETKIKNIKKVLTKNHTIHVVITKGGTEHEITAIKKKLEKGLKGVGIFSKVAPSNPRFSIYPMSQEEIKKE